VFTGRGKCAGCHDVSGARPLLTDFTSANIGVPRNAALAFLAEDVADGRGYVANPAGAGFVDAGLGGFLAASGNPDWQAQASRFVGAFQVPTLRNVAAHVGVRSFTHNGFFTDLKMLVHFYNTRDVLPRCAGSAGVGVTCWPAPEVKANLNRSQMGNLGLSDEDEDAVVAFLGTLTDGYGAGAGLGPGWDKEGFFLKKEPKTFARLSRFRMAASTGAASIDKSFLFLFFKKENLPLDYPIIAKLKVASCSVWFWVRPRAADFRSGIAGARIARGRGRVIRRRGRGRRRAWRCAAMARIGW
jgi:hypothetical protein